MAIHSSSGSSMDLTLEAPVSIDPTFHYKVHFHPTPINNLTAAMLALATAVSLAQTDVQASLSDQTFRLPDPKFRDVQIILRSPSQAIEGKVVLWGIFSLLSELVLNRPSFTKSAIELLLGEETKGLIVIEPATASDYTLERRGTEPTSNVTFWPPNLSTLPYPEKSTTLPSILHSNDHLKVATHLLSDSHWIGQGRIFVGLINAIIGLSELNPFQASVIIRFRNRPANMGVEVSPPGGGPRRTRPFNTRADSISTLSRIPGWMLQTGHWMSVGAEAYVDTTWVSSWVIADHDLQVKAQGAESVL
ncbi:uncharacterized protein KY384_001936 [Bacidia gigantensis]|uniref:uncharacterized protein n=1 Tax=Bacidia gigantensis TaxID=2732470 RepID=UPI001D045E01|nr:uncharacterized protein KY384_001936 [Bacidia gigantensis]KAG8533153.1 hypothetical protein KY384_001936 [Bacidia gigantensis]